MLFESRNLSVKLSSVPLEDELMRYACPGCDSTGGHPCPYPSIAVAGASEESDLVQLRRLLREALSQVN